MKKIGITITFVVILGTVLSGCGRKMSKEASPSPRNKLVIRLFNSMDRREYAAAAEQARKVQSLDSGNPYLTMVIARQHSNSCVVLAQSSLDAGNYDQAVRILEDGMRKSPLNRELRIELDNALKLRKLDLAVAAYNRVATSEEKALALNALDLQAAYFNDPGLQKVLQQKRRELSDSMKKSMPVNPIVPVK